MIAFPMQQVPPGSGSDRRRSGALSIRPSHSARQSTPGQATPGQGISPLFSTGKHETLEGAVDDALRRSQRGTRIVTEVRRTFMYAIVFLGVGLILALFVSTLWR
jgi:hypothetical protein